MAIPFGENLNNFREISSDYQGIKPKVQVTMTGLAKKLFAEKMGSCPWKEESFSPRWPFLEEFVQQEIFESVDLDLAKALLPSATEGQAAFLATLFQSSREGHLVMRLDDLERIQNQKLRILCLVGAKTLPPRLVVQNGDTWMFPRHHKCEELVLKHLQRILSGGSTISLKDDLLKDFKLTKEQKDALVTVNKQSFTLICGGPGTGKTHLASCLIKAFRGIKIVVAAPTGKAAANLKERLGEEREEITITTLHSLLKVGKRFPETPCLDADLIVIDEGSMIDARLFSHLLASIKEGAKCVIFGDPFQLPPVSSGSFFADLADKYGVFLKKCHRTDLKELIDCAELIKQGDHEGLFRFLETDQSVCTLKSLPKKREIFAHIIPFIPQKLESTLENFNQQRILTPLRKGPYGTQKLSAEFLAHVPTQKILPILIIANDPRLDLYNGDVGFLYDDKAHFPYRDPYPSLVLPSYEPAYFLSVHRSQGSEYEEVRILLPEGSDAFGRQMLYTAVTRARKRVCIYGTREIIAKILEKDERRCSNIN